MAGRVWVVLAASIVLGALGVFGAALVRQGGAPGGAIAVNRVGQLALVKPRPAVDFRLPLAGGAPFALAEHRGKVVVLNFWASWCAPCRTEAPALDRAWRAADHDRVALVGVAMWDQEDAVASFVRELGLSYPVARDTTGELVVEYGVTGIPETFVVAPNGQLVRRWIGPLDEARFRQLVADALGAGG